MVLLHHAYSATAKRKLLFAAYRDGGPWALVGNFDPRTDILREVVAAKLPNNAVEVVVTDEPPDDVLRRITKTSNAYYAAGLSPYRALPERMILQQKLEEEKARGITKPQPEPQTGAERARRSRDRRRAGGKPLPTPPGDGQSALGVPGAGDLVSWEEHQHADAGQPAVHGPEADGGSAPTPETRPDTVNPQHPTPAKRILTPAHPLPLSVYYPGR